MPAEPGAARTAHAASPAASPLLSHSNKRVLASPLSADSKKPRVANTMFVLKHLKAEAQNLNLTLQDVMESIENNIPVMMSEDVPKFAMQAASDAAAKKLEETMRSESQVQRFTKDELLRMYPDLDTTWQF